MARISNIPSNKNIGAENSGNNSEIQNRIQERIQESLIIEQSDFVNNIDEIDESTIYQFIISDEYKSSPDSERIIIICHLIDNGSDINYQEEETGETIIHKLAYYGSNLILEFFEDLGGNFKVCTFYNETPIHYLLNGMNDSNELEDEVEDFPNIYEQIEKFNKILNNLCLCYINMEDYSGKTFLEIAIENRYVKIVESFIKKQIDQIENPGISGNPEELEICAEDSEDSENHEGHKDHNNSVIKGSMIYINLYYLVKAINSHSITLAKIFLDYFIKMDLFDFNNKKLFFLPHYLLKQGMKYDEAYYLTVFVMLFQIYGFPKSILDDIMGDNECSGCFNCRIRKKLVQPIYDKLINNNKDNMNDKNIEDSNNEEDTETEDTNEGQREYSESEFDFEV